MLSGQQLSTLLALKRLCAALGSLRASTSLLAQSCLLIIRTIAAMPHPARDGHRNGYPGLSYRVRTLSTRRPGSPWPQAWALWPQRTASTFVFITKRQAAVKIPRTLAAPAAAWPRTGPLPVRTRGRQPCPRRRMTHAALPRHESCGKERVGRVQRRDEGALLGGARVGRQRLEGARCAEVKGRVHFYGLDLPAAPFFRSNSSHFRVSGQRNTCSDVSKCLASTAVLV